jgi:hypothetical protein
LWKGAVALAAAEHPSDHFGVQRAAAASDAGDGVDEALEVADAFFEEVADSFGAFADQVQGVALLVVLGEDEHAGSGSLSSYLDRCPQAVVSVAWGHVDVGDHDRGAVREGLA